MNNIKELEYQGKTYTMKNQIVSILKNLNFYWLLDAEVSNASIKIENNTIIWKGGIFLNGSWFYGIFLDGEFHGIWENGIFENGEFHGEWISGINNLKK